MSDEDDSRSDSAVIELVYGVLGSIIILLAYLNWG